MTVRWSPAVIERGEEGYGVVFPDGPGCVVAGDTVEQALSDAAAALAAHLDLLAREGEPLPEPGPADAPLRDWLEDAEVVARALVPVEWPGRTVRVNVTVDAGLLERIDRAARELGLSRSGLLAEAARRLLRELADHRAIG